MLYINLCQAFRCLLRCGCPTRIFMTSIVKYIRVVWPFPIAFRYRSTIIYTQHSSNIARGLHFRGRLLPHITHNMKTYTRDVLTVKKNYESKGIIRDISHIETRHVIEISMFTIPMNVGYNFVKPHTFVFPYVCVMCAFVSIVL